MDVVIDHDKRDVLEIFERCYVLDMTIQLLNIDHSTIEDLLVLLAQRFNIESIGISAPVKDELLQ